MGAFSFRNISPHSSTLSQPANNLEYKIYIILLLISIKLVIKYMHYLYGQVRVTVFVHISQTTHTKASQHFLDILGEVCYHWRPRSCNLIFVQTSSIKRTCQSLQFASKAFPCWLCPSARSAFPGMELLREHPLVPTGKNS